MNKHVANRIQASINAIEPAEGTKGRMWENILWMASQETESDTIRKRKNDEIKYFSQIPVKRMRIWVVLIAACFVISVVGLTIYQKWLKPDRIIPGKSSIVSTVSNETDSEDLLGRAIGRELTDIDSIGLETVTGVFFAAPTKVTSDQIKELTPTMTGEDILKFLGDTVNVGSGIYIYIYEVDRQYLLSISFTDGDVPLFVKGTDLLKTLKPIGD
ncbi:MAG: hypothetical protein J5496_06095 [Lachnospiraceae bacterium]|nr:hypothetical protein [Lachnospiraceae bacterium]